ncbi:MAG: SCP2 sterol-binding domain-containing protein [Chloroflexi bacterium]|nr:SCP2 sterol-binding domain-containing protein [Chloroflexota bacterium]
MPSFFPSDEWLTELKDHLNRDEKYGHIARNWEGDLIFHVEPSGALQESLCFYLDLWHGKCRDIRMVPTGDPTRAAFDLTATYDNLVRVLKGQLDPMQAMLTRKLQVKGSMPYMMRNVPTVLEFVRCAQDVTDNVLGD